MTGVNKSKYHTNGFKPFSTGDTIRFVVNKRKKTVHAQIVGKGELKLIISEEFCPGMIDFPKELQIGCSRYSNDQDVEIVAYREEGYFESEEVGEEEMDRIDFVLEKFGNLSIPLQNRELRLPRCFLVHSGIPDLFSEETKKYYFEINDLSPNIDEKKILLTILLGEIVDFRTEELLDYFWFFRRLRMKREMMILIERLSKLDDTKTVFKQLERVSHYEVDFIKGWFDKDQTNEVLEEQIRLDEINTSYTVVLLNILKRKTEWLGGEGFTELTSLMCTYGKTLGEIFKFMEKSYKAILDPFNHADLQGERLEEPSLNHLAHQLYNSPSSCNMSLRSTDNEDFSCHREMLCLGMNHFKRIFSFSGKEMEELRTTNKITVEDMDSETLRYILNFLYFQKPDRKIEIIPLIRMLILSRKYLSLELEQHVICHLKKQILVQKYEREEDVIRILKDKSIIFELHEDHRIREDDGGICKIILPLLEEWSKSAFRLEEMKRIIQSSIEQNALLLELDVQKEANTVLKQLVSCLKKIIEEKLGVKAEVLLET